MKEEKIKNETAKINLYNIAKNEKYGIIFSPTN